MIQLIVTSKNAEKRQDELLVYKILLPYRYLYYHWGIKIYNLSDTAFKE
jgi:hypothetical protein